MLQSITSLVEAKVISMSMSEAAARQTHICDESVVSIGPLAAGLDSDRPSEFRFRNCNAILAGSLILYLRGCMHCMGWSLKSPLVLLGAIDALSEQSLAPHDELQDGMC